jgi:hypothetical protein
MDLTETAAKQFRRARRLTQPGVLRHHVASWRRRQEQLRRLDTPEQHDLVRRLRDDIQTIARGQVDSDYWTAQRKDLMDSIAQEDPRAFLSWRSIRSSMFISPRNIGVDIELDLLRRSPRWESIWKSALIEDNAGCPAPYPTLSWSSGNLIHHAYHCDELERVLGRSISTFDRIYEFGAGYGSVARLAFRLGFTGTYETYDFPEFAALQRYYIGSVAAERGQAAWTNQFTPATPPSDPGPNSLFTAFWSLSEMPVADRTAWPEVIGRSSHIFIAYQEHFEAAENQQWFADLKSQLADHEWQSWPIATVGGSHYLLGCRANLGS